MHVRKWTVSVCSSRLSLTQHSSRTTSRVALTWRRHASAYDAQGLVVRLVCASGGRGEGGTTYPSECLWGVLHGLLVALVDVGLANLFLQSPLHLHIVRVQQRTPL
jgi:hypothetical protein